MCCNKTAVNCQVIVNNNALENVQLFGLMMSALITINC